MLLIQIEYELNTFSKCMPSHKQQVQIATWSSRIWRKTVNISDSLVSLLNCTRTSGVILLAASIEISSISAALSFSKSMVLVVDGCCWAKYSDRTWLSISGSSREISIFGKADHAAGEPWSSLVVVYGLVNIEEFSVRSRSLIPAARWQARCSTWEELDHGSRWAR